MASVHNDNSVYIWDLEKEMVIQSLELDYGPFRFSPDLNIMAGAVREEREYLVRLWEVDEGSHMGDLAVPGKVCDIFFSPDRKLMAAAAFGRPTVTDSGSATTIYDISSQELLYALDQNLENNDFLLALSFTPDGGHLAVAANNGIIELWRFREQNQ